MGTKRYFIAADLDYVQGHLRTGHLEGTVELTDEELAELKKDPNFAKELDLDTRVDSMSIDDVGSVDSIAVFELDDKGNKKEVNMEESAEPVYEFTSDSFKTEVKDAPKQGTEDWLNWRKDGITATEAASIMFPDKYNTPLKVYTDKVGLTQHDQSDPDGFFEWGHIIEDDLVRKFSEQHPEIVNITQGRLYQDGWKKCSLDAQGWDENGLPVIIECKTSQRMDKWTPFPDRYYAQVQWQMHITGIRRAIIAVLVAEGGWHYFEREIEYSPVFAEKMEEECAKVLDCVAKKTPPAQLSNFTPDKEAIAAIAGETGHKGSPQEIDQSLIDRYIELKAAYDKAEEELNQFKNEISYKMIDISKLTCNGHTFATWVERKGTVSIDKDRLKKEYPDIYQKVLKQGAGSRYIKYNT